MLGRAWEGDRGVSGSVKHKPALQVWRGRLGLWMLRLCCCCFAVWSSCKGRCLSRQQREGFTSCWRNTGGARCQVMWLNQQPQKPPELAQENEKAPGDLESWQDQLRADWPGEKCKDIDLLCLFSSSLKTQMFPLPRERYGKRWADPWLSHKLSTIVKSPGSLFFGKGTRKRVLSIGHCKQSWVLLCSKLNMKYKWGRCRRAKSAS